MQEFFQPAVRGGEVGGVHPTGPGVIYVTQPTQYDDYPKRTVIGLGIVQIVIGILCVVFNSVMIGVDRNYFPFVAISAVGHGYWMGILFVSTGCLGIATGKSTSKCKVLAFMVLSIISASLTAVFLFLGILGVIRSISLYSRYSYETAHSADVSLAMASCLMIVGVVEAGVAIWGSIIGCRSGSCCCCSDQSQLIAVPVQYFKNDANLGDQVTIPIQGLRGVQLAFVQPAPVLPNLPQHPQAGVSRPPSYVSACDQPADENRVSVAMPTHANTYALS